MNTGATHTDEMTVDGQRQPAAVADMTADELCARYDALGRSYRAALRENRPAETVLELENNLRRVGNQLRKRGL